MERKRGQLVIGLGEGADGKRLRGVLDRAAERVGKPISVWAREILLTAAGESKSIIDPIVELTYQDNSSSRTYQGTQINLRAVSAMRIDSPNSVLGFIGGVWAVMGHSAPEELLERWKRVQRSGLALVKEET